MNRVRLKACKSCRAIVIEGDKCSRCGSTQLTHNWDVLFILLDSDRSELAKRLDVDTEGAYALLVK
ncbi:MAG: DNA-directed RNA polymerase subunit E'' [Thermoproteota archaeon]|nr:MAG: DNA-directed RNA polymerase subunit E'' [Candidatus Korarchaeota archaeon]